MLFFGCVEADERTRKNKNDKYDNFSVRNHCVTSFSTIEPGIERDTSREKKTKTHELNYYYLVGG